MQRIMKYISENKINALHAIVICGLTAMAVYNAYWVLEDYINDNTMIKIEVKTARNILPYTRYFTVQYEYATDPIFPKAMHPNGSQYSKLTANDDGTPGWRATRRLKNRKREILSLLNNPVGDDLPLENALDITALSAIFDQMDREFLVDFTGTNHFAINATKTKDDVTALYFNLSAGLYADAIIAHPGGAKDGYTPEVVAVMSAFVNSANTERLIDRTLSQIVDPQFVQLAFPVLSNPYIPVLWNIDRLTDRRIQVTIPLDFMTNITANDVAFALLPYNDSIPASTFADVEFSHSQFFIDNLAPTSMNGSKDAKLLKNETIDTCVDMSNAAMFDSTEIYSESHCRKCENITRMLNCEFKCRVDWIVDTCGCIPFSFRRIYRGYPELSRLPCCTPGEYARCILSNPSRSSPCEDDQNSMPCMVSSHQEKPDSTDEVSESFTEMDQKYRLYFRLASPKGTYVIFENKFQNTWMQMLGQLGGNLGVFLSFSLFGVWQFIVFLHHWYKERASKFAQQLASDTQLDQEQTKQTADGTQAGYVTLEKRLRTLEKQLAKMKDSSQKKKNLATEMQKVK